MHHRTHIPLTPTPARRGKQGVLTAMLAFGAGLRWLVDRGFADPRQLDMALAGMLAACALWVAFF